MFPIGVGHFGTSIRVQICLDVGSLGHFRVEGFQRGKRIQDRSRKIQQIVQNIEQRIIRETRLKSISKFKTSNEMIGNSNLFSEHESLLCMLWFQQIFESFQLGREDLRHVFVLFLLKQSSSFISASSLKSYKGITYSEYISWTYWFRRSLIPSYIISAKAISASLSPYKPEPISNKHALG